MIGSSKLYIYILYIYFFVCVCVFLPFLEPLRHMEVPKLGVKSEL